MSEKSGYNYTNISTATTTVVKSGIGVLKRIVINQPVASGVITVYDNTSASGTKIATITHPVTLLHGELTIEYNVRFVAGLTVVTSSTDNITLVWE